MAATIGLGRRGVVRTAKAQAERISLVDSEWLTNPRQERLATQLIELAREYAHTQFVTRGTEANETALRLTRTYHVERGEGQRLHGVSPAKAYHDPTFVALALTGRPGLQGDLALYLEENGPENFSTHCCEGN